MEVIIDGKTYVEKKESSCSMEISFVTKPEPKRILVPDCIKIERVCGTGDRLGIVFNNGEQTLYSNTGYYGVSQSCESYFVKCELVKVKAEDRKLNHTYLRCGYAVLESHITTPSFYCKYLGDDQYSFADESKGITISDAHYPEWYEVRKIEWD